jgi:uncharacterized membrane protein YvlD (DUF360 family)
MHYVDRLLLWLQDTLPASTGHAGSLAAIPLLAIAAVLVVRPVVARVVRPVLRLFVVPLGIAVVGTLGLMVLTLDLAIASAFRAGRGTPPAVAFAIGDLALNGTIRAQRGIRLVASRWQRRTALHLVLTVLVVAALATWWDAGFCTRHGGAACERPLGSWLHQFRDWSGT